MIRQELKGPSHAEDLFTGSLRVLGGDEVKEPFEVGERSDCSHSSVQRAGTI
jgi:hypothetical protein